jgi:hypothetical protein
MFLLKFGVEFVLVMEFMPSGRCSSKVCKLGWSV